MEFGTVVRVLQGKETGECFVVVGYSDDRVLIANGKRHSLDKPKAKNPKHITPVGMCIEKDTIKSNKTLYRLLRTLQE